MAQVTTSYEHRSTSSTDFQGRALSSLTDDEIRAIAETALLQALKGGQLLASEAGRAALGLSDEPEMEDPEEADDILDELEKCLVGDSALLPPEDDIMGRAQLLSRNSTKMKEGYQLALISGKPDEHTARMTEWFLKRNGIHTDPETESAHALLALPPKASIPFIKAYSELLKINVTHAKIGAKTAVGEYSTHDATVERLEAKQEARQEKRRIKAHPQTVTIQTTPQQSQEDTKDGTGDSRKLSEAIAEMIQEKSRDGSWRPKVTRMEREKFALFQAIVDPDDSLPIASIGAKHLSMYKKLVPLLPAHRSKKKAYRDMDLPTLLSFVAAGNVPPEERIQTNTIKTYYQSATALINWAAKYEYLTNPNITAILEIKSDKQPHEFRDPFTNQDITKLFNAKTLTEGTTTREQARAARMEQPDSGGKASRFWVPLLGLFTGARLEELSQLHTDDFVLVNRQGDARRVFMPGVEPGTVKALTQNGEETLCLYINQDKPYQRLKNAASRRYVPLSPVLTDDLGFLSYAAWIFQNAEQARVKGATPKGDGRLFPELTRKKEDDNFAHELSKWFNKYRKAVGVEQQAGSGKKDFHSFRHTMARWCEQNDVAEKRAARHLGHSHDTMTFGRYSTDAAPHMLYEAITKGFSAYARSLLDIDGLKAGFWATLNQG